MSGRPILVLSGLDVWDISSRIPLPELLDVVHTALRAAADTSPSRLAQMPHRTSIRSDSYTTLFMPSRIESIPTTAIKVVSVPKTPNAGGLPATTLIMDEATATLEAVVNARTLTALRTAAASALATRLCLGKDAAPTHLVMFGAGAQIHAHAALLIALYPSIRHCTIINRSYNTRLGTLLDHLRSRIPRVAFVGLAWDLAAHGQNNPDVEKAVRGASIICTATSSTTPLFPNEWISPGTHINLVGSYTPEMHEVSSSLIKRAQIIIVDSRAACVKEAGELIAVPECLEKTHELGELRSDMKVVRDEGSSGVKPISIFKSVGVSVMDAAIAHLVVRKAREAGQGIVVPYD